MNAYTPHAWVLIKIQDFSQPQEKALYKVLCGEYGGYAYGDSWRLNSGIDSFEQEDNAFLFHGRSGSCYRCVKTAETLTRLTASMLEQFQEKAANQGYTFEHISSEDFMKEFQADQEK